MGTSWSNPAPETSPRDAAYALCLALVIIAALWAAFTVGQERRCNALVKADAAATVVADYCGPTHLGSRSWS